MEQPQLDLVFVVDCTGSMGSYIQSAQRSIHEIITKITAMEKCSVRFSLVQYRDHPPQDNTMITQVSDFTESLRQMKQYVDSMSASGGGDGPEALTAALAATTELPFRKHCAKVVVLIADAPPHGLEPSGDSFPDGSPDGADPLLIARTLAERDVIVYTVGVEPVLSSSYRFARHLMMAIAKQTNGQYLALNNASILAEVIVGGALEEIGLQRLMKAVESECEASGLTDEHQKLAYATERLQQAKVEVVQLKIDKLYEPSVNDEQAVGILMQAATLAEAKCRLVAEIPSSMPSSSRSATWSRSATAAPMRYGAGSYASCVSESDDVPCEESSAEPAPITSAAPQCASYAASSITYEQVSRVWNRTQNAKSYYSSE